MRVMVLYNPISGRGRACILAGAIVQKAMEIPCDVELIATKHGSQEDWLIPRLQSAPDAVVVVGGDGTLRSVASALIGKDIPVYHAASGTENLFAKSMGMSAIPHDVVAALTQQSIQAIDTATANDQFMLLMASVGFDASVVADLAAHRGNSITHISYLMPCIRTFIRWNPPAITIKVDGDDVVKDQRGWAVIANSKAYARGLNPARNANIADGELDIVFLPLRGRLDLLKWIRWMRRGTHLHHPDAIYTRGKHVVVRTTQAAPWQIDGDPAGDASEMVIDCKPATLSVLQQSIAVDDGTSYSSN